jgi:hypothetical protein
MKILCLDRNRPVRPRTYKEEEEEEETGFIFHTSDICSLKISRRIASPTLATFLLMLPQYFNIQRCQLQRTRLWTSNLVLQVAQN